MRNKKLYRLAKKVGGARKTRALMPVTAESCTGGWITEAVITVRGRLD